MPVRTMCVPQTRSDTPASRLSSVCIVSSARVSTAASAASRMSNAASRSAGAMTSGGASVSTLPWPTLNDRPRARHSYIDLLGLAARGNAVAGELDGEQQPDAADVGDERMARLQRAQLRERGRAQRARALAQSLALDHLERRQRRGAADRALLVRVVAERAVGGDVEVAPRDQRRHREHGAAESLAQHHHVGNDAVVLEGEHPPGAAEADRDLVEDQERAVAVARVANDPVVLGRRNLRRRSSAPSR